MQRRTHYVFNNYNNVRHSKLYDIIGRIIILLGVVLLIGSTACNSKDEDVATGTDYISSSSVAITGFSLQADLRVMKNLDSVFFSIDLEHGVVFNADSLPKGTNVTKLVPKITYPSSVISATIEMSGGTHREGTVNYLKNPTDTIDFTGDVSLTLATKDDALTKTYKLKVNVHREDPDTLYWDRLAAMDLPSRLTSPKAQKSVGSENAIYCLIEENDGTYTFSSTDNIFEGKWDKKSLNINFIPDLPTMRLSGDGTFYILSDAGELMSSTDGENWSSLASGWQSIIGMFGDTLLGTRLENSVLVQTSWPGGAAPEITMPADFPLFGFTEPIEFTNRWTTEPTIVIFGGAPQYSATRSPAWAYDGAQWVDISENALPALTGPSVVKYYSFLKSASNSLLKEFEVYLAFGGITADGTINRTVFISYDHGINWQRAQDYTQLPSGVATGYNLDALSTGKPLESNLSDRWKLNRSNMVRRLPFEISGDVVHWDCPYIFLFGGQDEKGNLNPQIRSGVLQRLTFAPLF